MPIKTAPFEDMTYFYKVFNVYVINTVKEREAIRDIEFNIINNRTINFTVRFEHPYLYGLLNKKNDLLYFEVLNETFLLANATNQTLSSNKTSKRIDMQFDFRGKYLYYNNLIL
jgi:hypothetical protein